MGDRKKKMNLKERAKRLKVDIPTVFLAMQDKETPFTAKLLALLTVVYALSPIDLIPDFVPILGYLDDVVILPAFIALTLRLIPKDVYEKNRKQAEYLWADGVPKKWYYSIPVILVWMLLAAIIIKAIMKAIM